MAKLIPWEDLRPGMTVYEEWYVATTTPEVDVLEIIDGDRIRMNYTFDAGVAFMQETHRKACFRYWDSKPTAEEMEGTEW